MSNIGIEDGGVLHIKDLTIEDAQTAEYYREIEDEDERTEHLRTAIRLGTEALRTLSTHRELDIVEKEFEQLSSEFDQRIRDTFGDDGEVERLIQDHFGEDGRVPRHIDGVFGEDGDLPRAVERVFGEDGELARRLEEQFGEDGKVVKELFDPTQEGSPLHTLRRELENELEKLRKDLGLADKEEELRQKTSLKGEDFEDYLEDVLREVAQPYGDQIERTSDKIGSIESNKTGDFVVTIGDRPDLTLVIEAKDKQMWGPGIEEEMETALANRGADYGILVSKALDNVPTDVGWFNEYRDEYAVVCLSEDADDEELADKMMQIAYRWARAKVLSSTGHTAEELDVKGLQEDLDEARKALKRFSEVRKKCTRAKNVIGDIETELDGIQQDAEEHLDAVEEEILRSLETGEAGAEA